MKSDCAYRSLEGFSAVLIAGSVSAAAQNFLGLGSTVVDYSLLNTVLFAHMIPFKHHALNVGFFPFLTVFLQGSQFLYSTYGFTLLSAVVERASGQKFTDYMLKMFRDLDMLSTVLDDNEAMIYNRAR